MSRALAPAAGASLILVAAFAYSEDPPKAGERKEPSRNVGYRVLDVPRSADGKAKPLTVAVWYPTRAEPKEHHYGGSKLVGKVAVDAEPSADGGPYPLLVFSHGYGGGGLSAVFLNEALAARGWVVAAPDHEDQDQAVRIRTGAHKLDASAFLARARRIASSGAGDRGALLYRPDELRAALDGVLASDALGKLVERSRIAVGGHSLGGFTALGLCGPLSDRRDDRVKGVLLFSTGAGAYLYRESELARVKVPAMLFLGERERDDKRGSRTMAELARTAFESFAGPKYFVELGGANHFSFNNRCADSLGARLMSGSEEHFDAIRKLSIAFLEKHVAGREDGARALEGTDPRITRFLRSR